MFIGTWKDWFVFSERFAESRRVSSSVIETTIIYLFIYLFISSKPPQMEKIKRLIKITSNIQYKGY